jgi:hypothetical protein
MTCPLGHGRMASWDGWCLDCQYCLQGLCDWPAGWRKVLESKVKEE